MSCCILFAPLSLGLHLLPGVFSTYLLPCCAPRQREPILQQTVSLSHTHTASIVMHDIKGPARISQLQTVGELENKEINRPPVSAKPY